MRMGQGVRTGLGHGGITCVLQTQFSSFFLSAMNREICVNITYGSLVSFGTDTVHWFVLVFP